MGRIGKKKSEIGKKTNGYFFDLSLVDRETHPLSAPLLLFSPSSTNTGDAGKALKGGVQPARRGERMWDQGAARRPARQRKSSVPSLSTPPSATPARRMHGTRRRRPSWTCQAVARLNSPDHVVRGVVRRDFYTLPFHRCVTPLPLRPMLLLFPNAYATLFELRRSHNLK